MIDWVVEDGFTGTFDQYNLYENRFSRILGLMQLRLPDRQRHEQDRRPAPLFDHGNSLFIFAGAEFMSSPEKHQEYVDTLLPRAYEDYVDMARAMMNDRNREQLWHLLTFRFKRHSHIRIICKMGLKLILPFLVSFPALANRPHNPYNKLK